MRKPRRPRVTVYQAADGWRWNLRAANGRIIADSGEAYSARRSAWRGFMRVVTAARIARERAVLNAENDLRLRHG